MNEAKEIAKESQEAKDVKSVYTGDLPKLENQTIISFFVVVSKQLRSRKDGGQYLSVTLSDRGGQVEGRMWENFGGCQFEAGEIVKVRAEVCRYNGRIQLNLEKIRRAAPEEIDLADYLPQTQRDIGELWDELNRYVDSFTDAHLKALVRSILDDEKIAPRLRAAPAAKSMHHAWLGGLLEHIVSLLGICDAAAKHYAQIHRDLLLTGAILHDIGKVEELSWSTAFEYTLRGQLLGHITIGLALLDSKLSALDGFPPNLRLLIEHMVLSHHGRLEFGSPKLPMIPEAVLLHYLDDLDAKMQTIEMEFSRRQAEGAQPGEMTGWVRAMDRSLLRTSAFLAREPGASAPRPASGGRLPGAAED